MITQKEVNEFINSWQSRVQARFEDVAHHHDGA